MSYFGHYVHSGYVTNPFLADDSRKCFFSFDYKNYNKLFIYYDKIMSSYIWTLNYPIWYAEDSKWGYDWLLTSFAIGGRAVLRYSSKYIYYDVKSSKLIIYSDLGYPCSEKAKLEYNYDTNRVETKYVWEDCFISNGDWNTNNITFNGKGAYLGLTLTLNFKINTNSVWIKKSSSTSPYGEYIPYTGQYGEAISALGSHFLGCKYWSSNKSVPNMQSDYGNISRFYLSPKKKLLSDTTALRYYDISDIEHRYDAANKKHRWIIWANRTKTRWYECNEDYPIESKDYTYTYYSTDGSTNSNLVLTFKGYSSCNGLFKDSMYYFLPCRMY